MLTAQGDSAPGKAQSDLSGGDLTPGFGLIAWPVEYGDSGVTTFIVNQSGMVFQADLGEDTATAVTTYDPAQNGTP